MTADLALNLLYSPEIATRDSATRKQKTKEKASRLNTAADVMWLFYLFKLYFMFIFIIIINKLR